MWNMNDVNVAKQRYEDIRRAAEKHNAIARMQTDGQGKKQGGQPAGKQKQTIIERVRKALR